MKKILFLALNARYTHSNLAVRYLRNQISDLDYDIEICELSINKSVLEILGTLSDSSPNIICLSLYIWNSELFKLLIPELKKILPNCTIVAGGPEIGYNHKDWIEKFEDIDYIVSGFAEKGFRYLAEHDFRIERKLIKEPNYPLNDLKFPYIQSDFPILKNKYIYYESSRGCPYRCSYCLSSRKDHIYETRDIETVKKELTFLLNYKPIIIKFVDRTFNLDKNHYQEIWKFLIGLKPSTRFHFEIHPDLLDESDFELLKEVPSDLFQFEIGIQTVFYNTLSSVDRKQDWDNTKQKIKELQNIGNIGIHLDLICGLPHDDIDHIRQSFDQVYSLHSDHFQLGFLKVLPGTVLHEKRNNYDLKFLAHAPYTVLSTKWLKFNEINRLKNLESVLNLYYNSGKFITTLHFTVDLLESSFKFFTSLAFFFAENNYWEKIGNWIKNAELLYKFILSLRLIETDLVMDIFRWDWCKIATGHYFPSFLDVKENKLAKETGYTLLSESISMQETDIKKSELKRTVFFQPLTNEFKTVYLGNSSIAVFLKRNDHPEILYI